MSSSYTTEPPPTATVLVNTTAGPLTISLFGQQTPLTCRNFLQHCLDGTYTGNIFHRISPGFVIQTGDPTNTGEGGENIYDNDDEMGVYDAGWARVLGREKGERVKFGDEVHSRLKFNRRGLVGMAKSEDTNGGYGSQWFITLGDARAQLDGRCTMFGRVEGEGIYNVVKIAEGELVEETERPVYPERILNVEVLEVPKGEAWAGMKIRERMAKRVTEQMPKKEKAKKKKKAGKALLSFGGDEVDLEDVGVAVRPKKASFNTALIDGPSTEDLQPQRNGITSKENKSPPPARRKKSPSASSVPQKRKAPSTTLSKTPSPTHHRTPSFHDSTTQLPLRNDESPSRSPSPQPASKTKANLESQIAALKESMRRPATTLTNKNSHKKSALESLIPATSTRGRKRPRPGDSLNDAGSLKMLNAFRARLESTDTESGPAAATLTGNTKGKGKERAQASSPRTDLDSYALKRVSTAPSSPHPTAEEQEESQLCDLHFIANCQSCRTWSSTHPEDPSSTIDDVQDNDRDFLRHSLSFAKDKLGKDLEWRRNMRNLKQEDMAELEVIDPKVRERELGVTGKGKERDRDWRR